MARRRPSNEPSNELENIDKKRKIKRGDLQKTFKLYSFVRPYRGLFAIGMVFLILSTLSSLTIPYLAGKFLDVATGVKTPYFVTIFWYVAVRMSAIVRSLTCAKQ